MPKKIINKEDTSPWSTSSQEIGRHFESKAKQEVRGGKVSKDIRAVDEKQPPLPQARPSTAPRGPEGNSFKNFVEGKSASSSSWDYLSLTDQGHFLSGNAVGVSNIFTGANHLERVKARGVNSSAKSESDESSRPPNSLRNASAKPVFLNFHSRW